MRSIANLLLIMSSVSIAHATDIRLNCTVEYDIDDRDKIEIPATIEADRILFKYNQDKALTYYFPENGPAVWHTDAKISFNAELKDGVLIYNYDFKNYLRDRSNLVSIFNETRILTLDTDEINDGEKHYFDFDDGEIISSEINKDDWINDEGIKLEDCEIYDLDLLPKDESIPLTPRQQRRHDRRMGPGFFERLFDS